MNMRSPDYQQDTRPGPWPQEGLYHFGRTAEPITILAATRGALLIAARDGALRFVEAERVSLTRESLS